MCVSLLYINTYISVTEQEDGIIYTASVLRVFFSEMDVFWQLVTGSTYILLSFHSSVSESKFADLNILQEYL